MKNVKITAVVALLGTLSFGAFAAAPVQTSAQTAPSVSWHATDIEAGSNIVPGATTTGKTMDDAFDSHTLVAGEWY